MPETIREDQASVSLSIDGRPCPFLFQKRSGGKIGSSGSKTLPGAMQPQAAHGGPQEIEDVTLEFEFVPSRDNAYLQSIKPRVGKGRANAAEQILDVDGNVKETIDRWTGVLSELDTGNYDATSSTPRMGVVVVEADGEAG
jgi:hypothetical protein